MALTARYPATLTDDEIVGRVMGPDHTGNAMVVATAAEHATDERGPHTRVTFRPLLSADHEHVVLDEWGQPYLRKPEQL